MIEDGGPRLALRRHTFILSRRVLIMGVVNATPDSFYDRGATAGGEEALARSLELVSAGADIIDIGGVKGGPGPEVTVDQELERVVPLVEALRARSEVVISVDTFRASVADATLEVGADVINDVTGAHDPDMLGTVAGRDAGYVVMHHGGRPRTRPFRRGYDPDVTTAVVRHCRDLAQRAMEAGIGRDRLIVDPGHDFQKTTFHSLELTRRLPELAELGFPVLVALSNKDFIGETLDVPLDGRIDGSLAASVFAITRGARLVRAHEVARTVQVVRMTEALLGWRDPAIAVRGLE